jgi:excisionase family DNA binding protein
VAAGTIRRWIREGRLTARRAGRVYRIGHDELERFLASDVRRASIVSVARAFLAGAG